MKPRGFIAALASVMGTATVAFSQNAQPAGADVCAAVSDQAFESLADHPELLDPQNKDFTPSVVTPVFTIGDVSRRIVLAPPFSYDDLAAGNPGYYAAGEFYQSVTGANGDILVSFKAKDQPGNDRREKAYITTEVFVQPVPGATGVYKVIGTLRPAKPEEVVTRTAQLGTQYLEALDDVRDAGMAKLAAKFFGDREYNTEDPYVDPVEAAQAGFAAPVNDTDSEPYMIKSIVDHYSIDIDPVKLKAHPLLIWNVQITPGPDGSASFTADGSTTNSVDAIFALGQMALAPVGMFVETEAAIAHRVDISIYDTGTNSTLALPVLTVKGQSETPVLSAKQDDSMPPAPGT